MDTKEKEIHETIRRDSRLSKRLDSVNKGYNFLNLDAEKRPYRVEVVVSVTMDLDGTEQELLVEHNLPIRHDDMPGFLEELSEWVKTPCYVPRSFNRKDKNSTCYLDDSVRCRRVSLKVSDVAIIVHEVAKEYLKREYGIEDFAKAVTEVLAQQKDATKEQIRAIDRWVFLEEREHYLDKMADPTACQHGYGEPDDKTKQFSISAAAHDKELAAIEKEMKALAKKHSFLDIGKVRFNYCREGEDVDEEEYGEDYAEE